MLGAGGDVGLRGAQVTIARVLAVAQWLRDEELIPATASVPSRHWKQELAAGLAVNPPQRSRNDGPNVHTAYTADESRVRRDA